MASGRTRILAGAGLAVGLAVASYPVLWRTRCLTWGATDDEVAMNLPGDDLLPDADVVTTRAVAIGAPPAFVWPWLVQMGSGRGGAYSYDWLENVFGLDMHSAQDILPQFQDIRLGSELPLGRGRRLMRVEVFDPNRAFALRFSGGGWVWIFALLPDGPGTRLVSRNRIMLPAGWPAARAAWIGLMEPGSLIMERKMLTGIRDRAERLARVPAPRREPTTAG